MLRVALTGGIGAGKSTVARRLVELGAMLVDADLLAREVVEPGSEGLAEVVAAFGEDVLAPDGTLDREAVARRVFGDGTARARLNAIVHPRVGSRTEALIAGAPPDTVIVQDVPLLVENHLAPRFHLVVVVHAPAELRVRRLQASRGMSEHEVRARMAVQADEAARRAAADVWLDNSGPLPALLAAVDALWRDRLGPFEANLRWRRPVPVPTHPVPADPDWPAQAARLAARIRFAAGERVLRVDHVGPTAVPGAAAPDVLDLRVTVAAPADVAAVRAALADAGFPPCPDAPGWYGSADPGRPVRLTVTAPGSNPGCRSSDDSPEAVDTARARGKEADSA